VESFFSLHLTKNPHFSLFSLIFSLTHNIQSSQQSYYEEDYYIYENEDEDGATNPNITAESLTNNGFKKVLSIVAGNVTEAATPQSGTDNVVGGLATAIVKAVFCNPVISSTLFCPANLRPKNPATLYVK